MTPRVLISDALSETAVNVFRERGVDVEFQPELGADKEKLAEDRRRVTTASPSAPRRRSRRR